MKAKREHIVPLSPQALVILDTMKPISSCRQHVFRAETTQNNQ